MQKNNKKILFNHFPRGRISKGHSIKMGFDISTRLTALKQAESQLASAKIRLKNYVGAHINQNIELTDKFHEIFPGVDINQLSKEMHQKSHTLKLLQKDIIIKEDIAKIHNAQKYPVLSAFTSFNYMGESDKAMVKGDKLLHLGAVGVNLTIPLWEGGAIRASHQMAVKSHRQAEIRYRQAKRELDVGLNTALTEFNTGKEVLEQTIEMEKLAKINYQQTIKRFSAGQSKLTDLNDSEKNLADARRTKISVLYGLHVLLANIEFLTLTEGML